MRPTDQTMGPRTKVCDGVFHGFMNPDDINTPCQMRATTTGTDEVEARTAPAIGCGGCRGKGNPCSSSHPARETLLPHHVNLKCRVGHTSCKEQNSYPNPRLEMRCWKQGRETWAQSRRGWNTWSDDKLMSLNMVEHPHVPVQVCNGEQ